MAGEGKTFPRLPGTWNSAQHVTADATGLKRTVGFIPAFTGELLVRARYDTVVTGTATYVAVPVVAGAVYAGDIEALDITNSTAASGDKEVTLLRQL